MAYVAIGGLIINLVGLFLMHSGAKHNLNIKGIWLHILVDTLGSVSTILAAVLIWLFGWYLVDPIVSVLLAIFIMVGAGRLLMDCANVLLEGTPKQVDIASLKIGMESMSGVTKVHDLHVWMVTSGMIALSAHVDVEQSADHGNILRLLTHYLNEKHQISHVTLQLEPPDYTD